MKWEVFEYTPDLYGNIRYGLKSGAVITAKSYSSKFHAQIACLIMNGDHIVIDEFISKLEAHLNEIRGYAKKINYGSNEADKVISGLILDSVNELFETLESK